MINKNRIGIFTPSTKIESTAESLDFIINHGRLIQGWTLSPELAHEIKPGMDYACIRQAVAEGKLRVSSLSGYMDWTEKNGNRQRRDEFKRIVDQCAACNTNIICTETGRNFTNRDNDPQAWELLADSLSELCDYAAEKNCCIAVEMGRRDLIFGVEYFKKLQEMTGKSNLKINFDPANLQLGEIDPLAAAGQLLGDIVQVHLKDADKRMRPLGQGAVDFKTLANVLENNGYQGNYIIETEYQTDDPAQGVSDDFNVAVKLLSS
jgi:sugar phosphate isomerase/epimerase